MPPARKHLFIFSLDRRVNAFLRNIVHNIIGREVTITGGILDAPPLALAGADLIMTSGAHLVDETRRRFSGIPILAPERIVTGFNLEKVLMLPKGTRVLVVNHPRAATEETIASLKNLGIDHLRYVPFWQGRDTSAAVARLDTAISPGMQHLCPDHVQTHIDIGPRLISMASFGRLLLALDLDLAYLERYANTYHSFLLEASRKLAGTLVHAELLAKRNEVILNEFEEGLVVVNAEGRIDQANRAAHRIVAPDSAGLLHQSFEEIIAGFEKIADLIESSDDTQKSASIYLWRNKQLIVTRIPVVSGQMRTHLYTFREIAGIQRLEQSVRVKLARKGYLAKYDFPDIWGRSPRLAAVVEKAARFARTDKTILITGESGTGKELFAHAVHCNSLRRQGPFVAVNFAGLPETLIESELFGYEKGAFTGALKGGKAGLFEQAHGGTIFLDEIGDAAPGVQSRLLRVIQEREVLPVGGSKIVPVDVRVIAATNTDLRQAMQAHRFREDLYYRLNTLPLEIPPLRHRPEDILDLFNRYQERHYGIRKSLTPQTEACLSAYRWPGNIRELVNAVDYAGIASQGLAEIRIGHLPPSLRRQGAPGAGGRLDPEAAVQALAVRLAAARLALPWARAVLDLLATGKPAAIGRNRLCRLLAARRMPLTEGRMKCLLKALQREDLVAVGTTKQGTTITDRGQRILDHLSANGQRD